MRAQIAFALRRGGDAPPLMLRAAAAAAEPGRRTGPADLPRSHGGGGLRGRLARGQDARQVAGAARSATLGLSGPEPLPHSQLLIHGLAERLAEGYLAAAPTLKEALRRYRAEPPELGWLSVSYNMVAMDLWDDDAWFELADRQVRQARASGTLSWLPFALDYLAEINVQTGELSKATALMMERERVEAGDQRGHPALPAIAARRVARGRAGRGRTGAGDGTWRRRAGRGRGADLCRLRAGGAE